MTDINDFFRTFKSNRDVFHDLMPLRTREILLVAPAYDAFTLEHDTPLSEVIYDDYNQLNLANAPRITSVSSEEIAVQKLQTRHFDLVILLSRSYRVDWRTLTERLRYIDPRIPILLLLNENAEIGFLGENRELLAGFDNVFVWNGNSEIFLAMVKLVEDRFNVANDTQVGLVRVILLVEDSIRYYSRYLPVLYQEIVKQTNRLIVEEHLDDMKKILRLRARPKVLLATSYEEALQIFHAYRDYLLCVISDVAYPKGGALDEQAGVKLIQELRQVAPELPVLLQSSNRDNARLAAAQLAGFIDKNSETLTADLAKFFYDNLGFGDFVFRNNAGVEVARAKSFPALMEGLSTIPAESVLYHASRNHFSAWLMARGEVSVAQMVFDAKVGDFASAEDLRRFLIDVGKHVLQMKTIGQVIPFEESLLGHEDNRSIMRLSNGSLGGKGRGIAFANSFLLASKWTEGFPGVEVRIPETAILGVDEFTAFIRHNDLQKRILDNSDPEGLKKAFLGGSLTPELVANLRTFLQRIRYPLAVRSSGLLEDSQSHPLSGLYQTFFLPNNHPDLEIRLRQVMEAIKLIFASAYSRTARGFFDAIGYKIEEEKMAIVLQQAVGTLHEDRFYPHLSGVAQSFNFYPVSYMEPSDGMAMVALGLGKYVAGGERCFRFCPAFPKVDLLSLEEQLKFSQRHFYALNLADSAPDLASSEEPTLLPLDVGAARKEGVIDQLASTYDFAEERLVPGSPQGKGMPVLNFAPILQFESFPLAPILQSLLGFLQTSLETPVEIEFAVNLDPGQNGKPTFYLLQVKHLVRGSEDGAVRLEELDQEALFLLTDKCMGNGCENSLQDIVWVDPTAFSKDQTQEMVQQIEELNAQFRREDRKYMLLGPGRWGTRDRWLGIPVAWPQISHAKIIVEYALENFQVDASLGSHFFHNITSMNVGYFTVPCQRSPTKIDWEWLRTRPVVSRTRHFVHTRLEKPLRVVMDGRKGLAVVFKDSAAQ